MSGPKNTRLYEGGIEAGHHLKGMEGGWDNTLGEKDGENKILTVETGDKLKSNVIKENN